ncbi:cellulose biosynthesis protein BcsC [Methylogaea oryzae]|uniref:cellulose biosynthesis protein BcsC n=1 Tax=Methylogaea oryzae TaxID=1295382 RepID=UPI0006D2547B|nr:cellulose biosynthesis protein BcsC [Methylogaea oryzae]
MAQWIKQADDAMLAERVDEAQEKVREALRLRPNDPDAMATQAEIHAGRNNAAAAAEPLFRAVLKADPANYRAVKGLATLMSKAGQSREARRFVEDVIKANPSQADSLADVAAGVIRDESDRLLAENRPEAALSLLEESRRLYPKASWLRYDLARLYARRGDVEGGRRLMAQGGGDPTDAYAQALFLSGLDDEAAALEALSRIPEDKEDASTRTLARQLTIRLRGKQAQALFAKDKKAARQMLEDAEALAENNADLRWEAAAAWLRIGEAQRGLELGRQLLGKGPITAEQRLAYANLLDTAKRDSELTAWLEKIDDSAKLSAAQKLSLQGLHRSVLMRRVDTLRRQQRNDEARQLLEAAMKQQAQDARLLTAEGELLAESGDTQAASRLFSQAIEIQPDYHDARIAQTKIWWESGEKALALRELENLRQTVPAEDKDTRLSLARRYTSQEQYDEARGLLKDLGQRFPGDENTLLQMGYTERAAENYDSAMSLFAQAKAVETPVPAAEAGGEEAPRSSASEAMDDIQLRRYGYFSTGWDQRTRTGDPGISQISNTEVPMYIRFADGYRGHWFAHVDQSTVDAGRLPLYNYDTAALFGKLQAYGANNLQGKAHELATGTAFGAGYESDNWRVDLGSSPQGFPISYWVGGIKNTGSIGDLFWSADFSRRPVSTSLTSYAGARDPVTGAVWGGVKKTGPEVYVGYDWGPVTLFAQGVYHYLNGTNVKANQEVMVRTGAELALLTLPNMRLSAGVALMHWRFEENQRYYTYGHGGYYSPQDYKSVSLPVQGSGRVGKFSYQVRGAITWAASYEENADFYPTSDTLQALAATQVLPKGYTNPIYKGSYGASFGYSASAAVEYQATPQLYLGGHWQMQHSPYYTPNYLGFYFRYAWEPREEPVLFPPKRLKPYYDF